ncbi:DUF2252 domain-containing protein [Burkholderia plantarii]|uniref:DUF2252 domain-containing protein n=1 Tax=Burkholderia plantarii TaxID=41899 RepID=UPI0007069BC9|nr:DUF2252 family protein [Burkholderia plantarii]ALK33786.1 hypothetical protein bpln_2g15600 [Burkholderia plantarii]GLZ16964.1 hypothetical protein Bpla01_04940 [Burkholderia plantarii]
MKKTWIAVAAACLIAVAPVHAQSSRTNWVVNQIYNANHPFAATDSTDLATKMSTMAADSFAFFRGTDHIFYQDMLTLPASNYTTSQTGYTWIGGDAHIGNFGAWQDSGGNTVFGVDDFDEGYLGQYVWDLRRLATSMVLVGRANGIADGDITTAIKTMVGAYVGEMSDFKGSSDELSFQLKNGNTSGVVQSTIGDAKDDSRSDLLAKYTRVSGGARSFQTIAGSLVPVDGTTYANLSAGMSSYISSIGSSKQYAASYYKVKDIHQKIGSGVGSLGKLRYYILIEGPSSSTSDDVILEVKQETASAVAVASGNGQALASADGSNDAARVAMTNKAQTLNADVLVGYATVNGVNYTFHEKSPYQEDFDYTKLTSAGKLATAATYLGQALASAHAISDQDYDSAIVTYSIDKQVTDAITSTSGLQTEISNFAFSYARQVNLDWQSFVGAYQAGTPLY